MLVIVAPFVKLSVALPMVSFSEEFHVALLTLMVADEPSSDAMSAVVFETVALSCIFSVAVPCRAIVRMPSFVQVVFCPLTVMFAMASCASAASASLLVTVAPSLMRSVALPSSAMESMPAFVQVEFEMLSVEFEVDFLAM